MIIQNGVFMKKMKLSQKEKRYLIIRFIILIVCFWFLGLPISMGHTFILEYPSQMSSRITNFQILDLKPNDTNYIFVVDYQVFNEGPFTAYSGKGSGGSIDLCLPFSLSSSNVNLENISISNLGKEGTLAGGFDRIRPGINDYNSSYEIYNYDSYQNSENFTLPDGDYYFILGKLNWNENCGVNFTITGENYTVNYEIPLEPWESDVLYLGDPYYLFYGCFSFIVLIGPIIYKRLGKQADPFQESNLKPEPNI